MGQSVHEAAPEAGVLPHGGAVGRGLRGSSCTIRVKQSSAAGGVLTGSRCRDGAVMAPSAAPSDEVMMYPGAVLHAVSVVVEVEASEVIPAALPYRH